MRQRRVADMAEITVIEAIRSTLDEVLAGDDRAFILGEDVEAGGVFRATEGLKAKHPGRVIDTPLAESSIVLETSRVEEFAPIKNASGIDSPATSHQIQSNRHGGWLQACGVDVPRNGNGDVDAKIEISAMTALDLEELLRHPPQAVISRGDEIAL